MQFHHGSTRLDMDEKTGLINPDLVGNHPNVNLPEALFQCRFELTEEGGVFRRVLHIYKQTDVLIRVSLPLMNPNSLKWIGQIRSRPKFGD
jgi:hypothetical protein